MQEELIAGLINQGIYVLCMIACSGIMACAAGSYVEGRRRLVEERFCETAETVRNLGHWPMSSNGLEESQLNTWVSHAGEAARSGWLTSRELAAYKEACEGHTDPEVMDSWKAGATGGYLSRARLLALGLLVGLAYAVASWGTAGATCLGLVPALSLCVAAVVQSDLSYRTIPSEMALALCVLGLAWQACTGGDVLVSAGFAAIVGAIMWLGRSIGASLAHTTVIGRGDVRLTAACFALAGADGALACILALFVITLGSWVAHKVRRSGGGRTMIPFGPAICVAAVFGSVWALLSMGVA
jgi:leader peptidase (prepilin peptidase)/N-methyltransferase